jgi:hypothetical protein
MLRFPALAFGIYKWRPLPIAGMFNGVVEAREFEAGIVVPFLKQARPILATQCGNFEF